MGRPPEPVIWRLHPTMYQIAVLGNYEAALWWTGPGTRLGWIIHTTARDILDAIARGSGKDEADAKAEAEMVLRALAALSPAQQRAVNLLAAGTVIYAYGEHGVSRATALALVREGLAVWKTEPHMVTNYGLTGRRRYQAEWALQAPPDPVTHTA